MVANDNLEINYLRVPDINDLKFISHVHTLLHVTCTLCKLSVAHAHKFVCLSFFKQHNSLREKSGKKKTKQ